MKNNKKEVVSYGRFAKIDRNILKFYKFEDIYEFRLFFMMEIKNSISQRSKNINQEWFDGEIKKFVFKNKAHVNIPKLEYYKDSIQKKLDNIELSGGFIIIQEEDLMNVKTIYQLYAMVSIKWGKVVSYIEKDVFYNWFGGNRNRCHRVVKRAFHSLGYDNTRYKVKNGVVEVYEDFTEENTIESIRLYSTQSPFGYDIENFDMEEDL